MQPNNPQQFTEMSWQSITTTLDIAKASQHQQMESEHLLKALIAQDGLATNILSKAGIHLNQLCQCLDSYIQVQPKVSAIGSAVYLGKSIDILLDRADEYRKEYGDGFISIEHLLLAYSQDDRFGKQFVIDFKLGESKLKTVISQIRQDLRVKDQNPEHQYELHSYYSTVTEEQEFTEHIELDDEPVEQNTAHSIFFDTYYNSLKDIELANHQLLDAQEQFRWYASQLDEVDRLADEVRISNSSTIAVTDLPQIAKLDRFSDEKDFQFFFNKVNQLKETKFQQGEEINNAEKSSRTRLSTLDSQLASISSEIKRLEAIITTEEGRINKNIQMFFAGTAVFIAIIIALIFPAFGGWILLPGLCAAFVLVLIKMDLL